MKNLGIGHRAPTMQNGQVPGVRRQYDMSYALMLEEIAGRYTHMYVVRSLPAGQARQAGLKQMARWVH